MFTKQFCQRHLCLQRQNYLSEILWRLSYSKDSSHQLLEDILANPGPESKLPDAMNTEFKDMEPEMQEKFKKIIKCEYKVRRLIKLNKIVSVMTEDMWNQLYHARFIDDRNKLMEKFYGEQESEHFQKNKKPKTTNNRVFGDSEAVENTTQVARISKNIMKYSVFKPEHFQLRRQTLSQLYGLDLVIDLKGVHEFKRSEQVHVLKTVHSALGRNFKAREPFHITVCNAKLEHLQRPQYDFSNYFEDFTEKSYLDLFPRRNLVYLSPSSNSGRVQFDPRLTYIIGGLCTDEHKDISLERAKKDNIKTQELPLRNYLRHVKSRLAIPIDEVLTVMLSLRDNDGDYLKAFRSIISKPKGHLLLSGLLKGSHRTSVPSDGQLIPDVESFIDNLLCERKSSPRKVYRGKPKLFKQESERWVNT